VVSPERGGPPFSNGDPPHVHSPLGRRPKGKRTYLGRDSLDGVGRSLKSPPDSSDMSQRFSRRVKPYKRRRASYEYMGIIALVIAISLGLFGTLWWVALFLYFIKDQVIR